MENNIYIMHPSEKKRCNNRPFEVVLVAKSKVRAYKYVGVYGGFGVFLRYIPSTFIDSL